MHRQIAGKLTGPVTKWIVLARLDRPGSWSGYLGAKLADVQNNEAVVLAARVGGVDQGRRRALRRRSTPTTSRRWSSTSASGGLTEDDLAAIDEQGAGDRPDRRRHRRGRAHAQRRGRDPGTGCRSDLVSEDGEVAITSLHVQLRQGRLERDPGRRRRDPRHRRDRRRRRAPGRLRRPGRRLRRGLRGHRHAPWSLITLLVVILILLITYRSPILWILPIFSVVVAYIVAGGVVYLLAKYADLDGQRPEPGILQHPGHRRRHRLRAAARRPISRGAAPPRGPARGDGVRAAPGGAGHPGQRRDGRRRPAVPVPRRPQLDRGPRSGAGRRRRRDLPGHGHAAARPAGDLRALDLLAEAPDVRLRRAHHDRLLGPRRSADRASARARSGSSPPWCSWRSAASACSSSTPPACRPRTPSPRSSTRSRARSCWSSTACRTTPTPSRSSTNDDQLDGGRARRSRTSRASVSPTDPTPTRRRPRSTSRRRSSEDIASTAAFDIVEATRDAVHAVDGADALVGGGSAFYLDTKTASIRDNKVIIPLVLLVVFLILMLLLRALSGAADPDRDGGPVLRGRAGDLGAAVRVRLRLRRVRSRRSRCSRSCSWSPWASTTTSS